MGSKSEILKRAGRTALAGAIGLASEVGIAQVASAEHDSGRTRNASIERAQNFVWFHPMNKNGEVWSYGFTWQKIPGTSLVDTGRVGEVILVGSGDLGLNLHTNPQYLADYRVGASRAALWGEAGKGDEIYLMDENNNPIAMVVSDSSDGFFGFLVPDFEAKFGVRVRRTSGSDAPVYIRFGNLSHEDARKPRHASVIDVVEVLTGEKIQVETSAGPDEQILEWEEANGVGLFRPRSSSGEAYSRFAQFAFGNIPRNADGSAQYRFEGGNVGEFFAHVNGAAQVRLLVVTQREHVEDIRQGEEAPALWVSDTQGRTRMIIHDLTGRALAQVNTDLAGFGGVELPENGVFILTFNMPEPGKVHKIRFQLGPANREALAKASTLKTTGFIDPSSI